MKSTIKEPTQPVDESPEEEAGESKTYEKHEIESAARSLMEAEKVKSNKTLHGHALKHLAKQHSEIGNIVGKKPKDLQDLRSMASMKSSDE